MVSVFPASYYTLPDEDSLSVTKRVPYILHAINMLFALPSVGEIVVCSYSEYNLNYLLSFLLKYKHLITAPNLHLLCLTETNIHREMRSRIRFLSEAKADPTTHIVTIVNDCLLPICAGMTFDAVVHFDLPLSESVFLQRQSLRCGQSDDPTCNLFFPTSAQIESISVLFAKYKAMLTPCEDLGDISMERKKAEQFAKKKKELRDGVVDAEEIDLDGLTKEQEHSLFYQNEKSVIVKPEEKEYVELKLDELDAGDLDDIDTQLEVIEREQKRPCSIPMIPVDVIHSVFNPFFNPGVLHCFDSKYSPFCCVCFILSFCIKRIMLSASHIAGRLINANVVLRSSLPVGFSDRSSECRL